MNIMMNIKETCRICCNKEGVIYLFSKTNDLQISISAKLMYCCVKVNITEGDGLPSAICKRCEAELEAAYLFVLKCEVSDKRLRSEAGAMQRRDSPALGDGQPKIEVKLEDSCNSDNDNDCHDVQDDYSLLDIKQNLEIKIESKSVLNTRTKKLYTKRVKYKDARPFVCSVCSRTTTSRSALVVHMRHHTGDTPFSCPSCEKKYKDRGSLKRHMQRHHFEGERERNFICENCGKKFFSKNDVKIHMRTHTGETPYICQECPMRFTQVSALLRHKKRHSGEKPHACSSCAKRFCTKDELKYHLLVHSDVRNYSCTICNSLFKYQNNLRKHMQLHSKPNNFICNYCGKTFNQKGNLKSHIDRQHSEKSGYCIVCSKNVSNFEVHMWRHNGLRPLKCELCSSSFYDLKTLGRHVNYRHKHPDKYKCLYDGCAMTFPSRPMLGFHVAKLHETVIPFPCDRCTRGFYRKNDLARHKIGTHKERLVVT